jgi:hypothetical protein
MTPCPIVCGLPQGAVCPGGFRMWPAEGYWNDEEVGANAVVSCGITRRRLLTCCLRFRAGLSVGAPVQPPFPTLSRWQNHRLSSLHERGWIQWVRRRICRCDGCACLHEYTDDTALHVRAGPYCSACAEGYFEKGKLCAPCDKNARNIMYEQPCAFVLACALRHTLFPTRLGIMFIFVALFVVGIFFCPPNTVFAVFDLMAERPLSRCRAETRAHAFPQSLHPHVAIPARTLPCDS